MDSVTLALAWWSLMLIGVAVLGLALVVRSERNWRLKHEVHCDVMRAAALAAVSKAV